MFKHFIKTEVSQKLAKLIAVSIGLSRFLMGFAFNRVYAQLVYAGGLPPLGLFVDESTNCLHDGSIN
jgi:hypothetical protein